MQGDQQGNVAAQGMVPNAQQPMGSPQLYVQAISLLRQEVANLNKVQDMLFRTAGTDDVLQKAVKDIMGVTHKVQGISTTLEQHQKELMAQQQPQQAPMQGAMPQGAMG